MGFRKRRKNTVDAVKTVFRSSGDGGRIEGIGIPREEGKSRPREYMENLPCCAGRRLFPGNRGEP